MDYAALIIYGTRCAVFHSLRHVVNINVITENFSGVAVFGGYRRTSESDECCVRKGVADDAGIANYDSGFGFALFIFAHDYTLIHAVLATVRLVCHNHDVASSGQRLFAFLKFEHGGKDNAVG